MHQGLLSEDVTLDALSLGYWTESNAWCRYPTAISAAQAWRMLLAVEVLT